MLTACGSGAGGLAKARQLPENVRSPCARPETYLAATDWAIMAGQIGAELIHCENKRAAAVVYGDALAEATVDPWKVW